MHKVPYVRHLGYQNTLAAVKKQYYWHGMNNEVVLYISKCLECPNIKDEHGHPTGVL
jgi:hypothetical protein